MPGSTAPRPKATFPGSPGSSWARTITSCWISGCSAEPRLPVLDQLAGVAGEDLLAVGAERAQLLREILHHVALAHLLRIVGGEDDACGRNLHERRLDGGDLAAESGGIEEDVVAQ